MKSLSVVFLLMFSIPSYSQNSKVIGCYASNFAVVGWFGTHIELKSDSTFKYVQKGDLMCDGGNGNYELKGNVIHLKFEMPKYDTLFFTFTDSLSQADSVPIPRRINQMERTRPKQLIVQGNKLFFATDNGKKDRKNTDSKGRLRSYYLKRHEEHSDAW